MCYFVLQFLKVSSKKQELQYVFVRTSLSSQHQFQHDEDLLPNTIEGQVIA